MIQQRLTVQLGRVTRRLRSERFLRLGAAGWLLAAAVAGCFRGLAAVVGATAPWSLVGTAASVSALLALGALVVWRCRRVTTLEAARAIERRFPDLNQRVLAAVEQQPHVETGRLGYLQRRVVAEAVAHGNAHDWGLAVPASQIARSLGLQFVCMAIFAVSLGALWLDRGQKPGFSENPGFSPSSVAQATDYAVSVEPGDAEIERGNDLLVTARFDRGVPSSATLLATDAEGNKQAVPLTKSLDDPLFAGRIGSVQRDTNYRIEYHDRRTDDFRITVFDYPALERLDVAVAFPDYTGLPETAIEDTRQVSVVEGSAVTLSCFTNKPLAAARLVPAEGDSTELTQAPESDRVYRATIRPETTTRYLIGLTDRHDRRNKTPIEFTVEVLPNRRPELKLAFPARDIRVSPIEEVALEATVWDDYGVPEFGLIYTLPGQQPATVVLGSSVKGKERQKVRHLLSFEALRAEPDQLLAYYFYADDHGSDGKIRRTYSDMYFAEVRHFEEIFREGQQPPGGGNQQGGGGQQSQAEKLAELQKQIVTATWKIIRRESGTEPTERFVEDVQLVKESQESARGQLRKIEEKVRDARSKALVRAVGRHMGDATRFLDKAAEQSATDRLPPALGSEQAAYQALLKLRAREHRVVQSQSGGGGGGSSGRSQQQLNQLELSNKQNRYQNRRQAANNQSSPAEKEQLQVLSRLRELARRQGTLNERLKELENALRRARTQQEKDEIRRQLKRLREEQEKTLRDVDELRNRMNRPENQQRMADERRRLDETRDRVLRASESLRQGRLSQALNSGTRAERELSDLKEQFRKKTSSRFADDVRELRSRSQRLAEEQQKLAEGLREISDDTRRSLRTTLDRRRIERGLNDQEARLRSLLDRIQDVVREAEPAEPLLSQQLYDTVRKARDHQPEKNLHEAQERTRRGRLAEASRAERAAGRGIEELRRGIEQASEAVLGDELESLRRAEGRLDELRQAVENELAQNGRKSRDEGRGPAETGEGRAERGGPQTAQADDSSSAPDTQPSALNTQQSGERKGENRQARANGSSKDAGTRGGGESSGQPPAEAGGKPGPPRGQPNRGNQGSRGPLSTALSQGGQAGGPGNHGGRMRPLTGDDFIEWSDRMREVEEMVSDPELRSRATRIRERARSMRVEFKRHSKQPNWDLVHGTLLEPLIELQHRVAEEIARRESKKALVPIDRDPVPERFSDLVEEYYKRIGQGD